MEASTVVHLSRGLFVLLIVAVSASAGVWGLAQWMFEHPRSTPYSRANMNSCPLPVGDRRGFWSVGESNGDRPFIGFDRRMRYKDPDGHMHSGDMDQVMAIYSRASGFWGLKWEPVPGGALVLIVVPDLPAAAAGLAPGDTITAVDGELLAGKKLKELAALLRPGGERRLTVFRGEDSFEYTVGAGGTTARRPD